MLGHALCALLIYCLWWNKPLDAKEPEQMFLRTDEELQFGAVLCTYSALDDGLCEFQTRSRFQMALRSLWTLALSTDEREWGGIIIPQDESEGPPRFRVRFAHHLDSFFFPVITLDAQGKRWVAGLGATTVHRGRDSSFLQTEANGLKFKIPLPDRNFPASVLPKLEAYRAHVA